MRTVLRVAVILTAMASSAWADERQEVTSIRPLLLEAIDKGKAHGAYVGPGQQLMQTLFRTTEPMQIDVRRIMDLPTPGCNRLEVATTQRGVHPDDHALKLMTQKDREETENGTKSRDVSFKYQINFCRDGSVPKK